MPKFVVPDLKEASIARENGAKSANLFEPISEAKWRAEAVDRKVSRGGG